MKKINFILIIGLLFSTPPLAGTKCFLIRENNKIIMSEGACETRHSPCSTFKIAISLMGYNEGLLIDETHPEHPFQNAYIDWVDLWKITHNPSLWIKNSCAWYSQILTQQLGIYKFKDYVSKFNYGNQDVSGDKDKNNGLTVAWLSSSLKISAEEQTVFLQKLLENKLPVSLKSQKMTKNILFVEDLQNGWKLYGKTGTGCLINQDGSRKLDPRIGWFIGWIEKDNRTIIFAHYIEDEDKQSTFASSRAKTAAKEKLMKLVQKPEPKEI